MGSKIGLLLRRMKGAGTEANGYGYGRVATGEYTTFNIKKVRLQLIWLRRIIELCRTTTLMIVRFQVQEDDSKIKLFSS